jgi:hypothetical protein
MRRAVAALSLALLPMTAAAQTPIRLYFSGHSLLDEPLPREAATIAASLGTPLAGYTLHAPAGSSMRERAAAASPPLAGHDGLIVTEQHTLVGNLVWNDTVSELRRLHERFVAANPRGRVWFYEPWLNVSDRSDPRRWIAYERAASPVWQCVVARVNAALEAGGRHERIASLPAAALLAALVERATQGPGLPGVCGATPQATMQRLFSDDVHLTPLGAYFMSLVVVAWVFERSPEGAPVPAALDAIAARTLQGEAWRLVRQQRSASTSPALPDCRARLAGFVGLYTGYLRDAVLVPQQGTLRAYWQALKWRAQWQWRLREGAAHHPLRLDASVVRASP